MKKILRVLGFLLIGGIVITILISLIINISTRSYIYKNISDVPEAETGLLLGAAVLSNGNLSGALRDRADTAISLYKAKKVKKILVTGDNSRVEYNEVNPVRNYLLKAGVLEGDIVLDYAGFDTYSSMYRSRDIFLTENIIIITQSFHLPRAVFIARNLNMNATGVSADNGHMYSVKNSIRETFANIKAVLNLLVGREPKFLGQKKPITDGGLGLNTEQNCEFDECLNGTQISTTTATTNTLTILSLKVGEGVNVGKTKVTLDKIISDSRCPKDVTCIWSGEVSVSISLSEGSTSETLILKDTSSEAITKKHNIKLIDVKPEKISTVETKESDYVVTLEIRGIN